jgi:hypothetical protein
MEGDFERRTRAIADVQAERDRQVRKGWSTEHDDGHTGHEWSWIIGQRVIEILDPAQDGESTRQLLVEIAAIAVAGLEAYDRHRAARALPTAPVGVTDVTDSV